MSKLHELLAVEGNLVSQAQKATNDLTATFTGKRHLFEEKSKVVKFFDENMADRTEEQSSIQTTVANEMNWLGNIVSKAIDAGYQIDSANTQAKADLVVDEDGTPVVLAKDVPTTALLRLEHRLGEVRNLIQAVPTLDPAKGFQPDTARGKGIFKAREEVKPRTKKDKKVLVKSPSTDRFPAQVDVYDADVEIGMIHLNEWNAMITPATKAELINRCDQLLRAVKKARARANQQEVDVTSLKLGKKLFDFILQPLA